MKEYDHKPTIEELLLQLTEDDPLLPDFLPPVDIPEIKAAVTEGMIKSAMDLLLT